MRSPTVSRPGGLSGFSTVPHADPTVPGMTGSEWCFDKHLLDGAFFFFYVFAQSQKCRDLNRHCSHINTSYFSVWEQWPWKLVNWSITASNCSRLLWVQLRLRARIDINTNVLYIILFDHLDTSFLKGPVWRVLGDLGAEMEFNIPISVLISVEFPENKNHCVFIRMSLLHRSATTIDHWLTCDIIYLFLQIEEEHLRWELSDIMSIGHTGNRHKGFNWKMKVSITFHH